MFSDHLRGNGQMSHLIHNEDHHSLQSLNVDDVYEVNQFTGTTVNLHHDNGYGESPVDVSHRGDDIIALSNEHFGEGGLPSTKQRLTGLTKRLYLAKQQQSAAQVAKHYRKAASSVPNGRLHIFHSCMVKRVKPVSDKCLDVWHRLNFWSQQFKEIEGHCGVATTTYFRFTRWLVKINFMVFFLFLCFIYIPQLTHISPFDGHINATQFEAVNICSQAYAQFIRDSSRYEPGWQTFLQVAQGTGILENTMLFYGNYYTTFRDPRGDVPMKTTYNMGLAYLLTVGLSLLVVFVMIVKNSSKTVEEAVLDFDNKTFPLYTNAVFSVWDFCINSEKTATLKHKIIYNNFKAKLEEVESKRQREKRTAKEKARMYLKRVLFHFIVVALLGASFYAIYAATDFLLNKKTGTEDSVSGLLLNYLPTIVITGLNLVVPQIFHFLSKFEEYTPNVTTYITIVRAVLLRLASVWVLIVSLYYQLIERDGKDISYCEEEKMKKIDCCGNTLWNSSNEPVKCWESYVGKQFYKLGILDFVAGILVVFLVKFPRRIIYQRFKNTCIMNKVGVSQFDLSAEVLDIVYSQSVCWMGMFFTPLLPAISFVKVFVFFFLKKFELLSVSGSPRNAYRASRSYSFFQTVLLMSFIVISGLLGYMIGNLPPSKSCGPFRSYSSDNSVMFDVISDEVESWPDSPKKFIRYFGTVAFFIPAFLILLVSMYYHWAIAVGYKKMEELLKQQLKSEAHDKQYLLARVDEIIKNQLHHPHGYQ